MLPRCCNVIHIDIADIQVVSILHYICVNLI